MERVLENILPIMDVEHDLILSKQGDITIAFRCELPEIFTLSNDEYEAFHQAWIKAIKILPKHSILHKQDWFIDTKHKANFLNADNSFLSRSSERFFNERPYLDHSCYIFLTKKPAGRKLASSLFSNLLRRTIVPEETLKPQLVQDFLDSAGQFKRILEDSGFVKLKRLTNEELLSNTGNVGVIEKYLRLSETNLLCDIEFKDGIQVGDKQVQLFTLSNAEDLPALCGSRINYDKYSTDKTKFSIGFASTLGQLLPCNHIYNQF
ncbi:MAG TPA: TraG family conjugative transposon ATPase, partial [Chitinophagaceae bacterium]|nr:TraG family conjugative transposon ATPase [Chitinophagaceae bacterium]